MDSKYLKYGSLITLSTCEGYFLYSQGFIDSSPYLREQTRDFSEFTGAVFRIVPQSLYNVQSSIIQFIKETREGDFYSKLNELNKMEENLEGEIKTNIHLYNSYKGQIVTYNSLVQLEHFTSHKFLTLHSKSAEAEKDNFKVSFKNFPSENSHFRIVPSYKFQEYGSGKIKIFDKIYLEIMIPNLRKIAWMHSSKGHFIEVVSSNINAFGSVADEQYKAIEVNVSLDQRTRWSIGIYGDLPKDLKFLSCGDCIWLNMPEENVSLSVYKKRWEVEKYKLMYTNALNDTNGLWKIEFEDPFKGGPVIEGKKYRLKHIVTGKYLAIGVNPILKSTPGSSTLWRFMPFKNEEFIKSDELTYIINDKTGYAIKLLGKDEMELSGYLDENCIYKPCKANNEVIWELLFLLHCYPILINFPKKLIQHSHLSLSENIRKFPEFRKHCDILLICLKQLKLFVGNRLKSMIGIDNHFGEVTSTRQLMLKQQHFFEAFASILEHSVPDDQYETFKRISTKQVKERKLNKTYGDIESARIRTISMIISQIYSLLIKICERNSDAQRHAYKFIDIYIKHIGLDLGATDLLLAIIRNNEEIMLEVHQNIRIDIINFYSSMLLKFILEKKTEFIGFLNNICVYKGEPVSANQEKVFASIFKNDEIVKNVLINTETDGNELFIFVKGIRISLLSCFEDGRINGYDIEMQYLTGLLELYSNLCSGRNFESSALFIEKYPFEVLNLMIWNSHLTIDIRASFCKLMLAMYIDCFMREEVAKPELIKIINTGDYLKGPRNDFVDVLVHKNNSRPMIDRFSNLRAFELSEASLPDLIEKIFDYFETSYFHSDFSTERQFEDFIYEFSEQETNKPYLKKFYNVFTFEILQVTFKLIKFQKFSLTTGVNESGPFNNSISTNSDMVRLMRAILPLLLDVRVNDIYTKTASSYKKRNKKANAKLQKEKKISYIHYLSSIFKDSNSLNDPVIRSAANLKNFLSSYKQNPFNGLEKKMIEHRIKLKICKIIEYFLDMRQDYLINNVIQWYNGLEDYRTWEIKDLEHLLPNILVNSECKEIFSKVTQNIFKSYYIPQVPDINSISQNSYIIPSLFNSFIYCDNYKLQTQILSIIFRAFTQRKEFLKNIKKLHVIFKPQDISLLNWIKSSLLTFKHHSEQSELWLNYWNSDSQYNKHKEVFDKMKKILRDIECFLYDDVTMTEDGPSNPTSKTLSKSRQEMLFYLNAHKFIITLLKDGVHKLASIYNEKKQDELKEACGLLSDLFTSCHIVLKRFVYNNTRNQKKLHKYMNVLLQYLYLNLGQVSLICEIYRDNIVLVNSITEDQIIFFEELIKKYGRQAHFLKILEVVQVVKQKPIAFNQRMVMSLFIKEKLNTYMLYMNEDEYPSFVFNIGEKINLLYKDEPFEYHAMLLKVLSNCGFGASGILFNEIKCQNIVSLKNIFRILYKCEEDPISSFQILKMPMLNFFFNVYLDCEITNLQLKSYKLFFKYIGMQCQVLDSLDETTDTYIEFLAIWVKILNKYRSNYIKKINRSYYEQDDVKAIRYFIECLIRNCTKLTKKLTNQLVTEIYELSKFFGEEFNNVEKIEFSNNTNEEDDPEIILHRVITNVDHTSMKSVQIELWNQVRNAFNTNKIFKTRIEDEEYALLLYIHNSNILFPEIDFEKIIRSLISFTRLSRSQKPPISVQIMSIQLLEKIISRPICNKYDIEKKLKIDMQYHLSFLGLTNVILNLMVDSQLEYSVFKSLISLSVQLLDGGNPQIQQEFYQYFLTTSNSEYFFQRISQILKKKIEKIAENSSNENRKNLVYKSKNFPLKKLLRFLQLLCEHHNHSLQVYIRYQEKSHTSYNLVLATIDLLEILMKKKKHMLFHVLSQCFETINEFMQGPCLENQDEVVNSKFLEITNELLSLDETSSTIQYYRGLHITSCNNETSMSGNIEQEEIQISELSGWMIAHLKYKCLITILSIFEGRKDTYAATRVIRVINIEVLEENIKNLYMNYQEYYKWEDYYDFDLFKHIKTNENYDFSISNNPQDENPNYYSLVIENGFLVLNLLKTLLDSNDPDCQEILSCELPGFLGIEEENFTAVVHKKKIKKTFTMRAKEIKESVQQYKFEGKEIEKNNENITKAAYEFFEKHTGNVEVVFNREIFRVYFYYPPEYKGLTKEIKEHFHRNAIRDSDQSKLKYMLDSTDELIKKINHEYFIKNIMKKSKTIHIIATNVDNFRKIAFFLTIILNLIILTSYSHERDYESVLTFTPDDEGLGNNLTVALLRSFGIIQLACCAFIVAFFLLKVGPLLAKQGWELKGSRLYFLRSGKGILILSVLKIVQIISTTFYILSNVDVVYYILYAVFSILGIIVHPFYFSLLLLDVIYRYPALHNVVNSIYLPRKALVLTFLLLLVIIYIFSIIGYWLFFDYLSPDCKTLLQCLLTIWDRSFKNDGGIGGYLGYPITPSYDAGRFFYDNIYNIIVVIVLMGVVQGIIIDTFARLREGQEFSTKDRESKCFICGLQRDFIEKKTSSGFEHHILNDHNEWNYILFIAYLKRKNESEYSGLESYIKEQYEKNELGWIPNQICLSFKNEHKQDMVERIENINEQLDSIEEQINNFTNP
ncbi:hypothetical protein SteCoe_23193 [Stentor coeruleus]|uniref:MIR domain-containing protein n=1 Tax=Stentor coeruleus TaxID=5963 RepID=A0A1R2BKY3_9CILI|nr:hypothetical protein SteCoe_23193 [Stentor coeruleus]